MEEAMNLVNEELIFLDLEVSDAEEALEKMAKSLYAQGFVKESYIKAVLDREKVFPTGLPTEKIGVAIPHTDAIHVKKGSMAIGILKNPVPFHVMGMSEDTVDVSIIFMMALENAHGQIEMLQRLMEIFQQEGLLMGIKESKDPSEVKAIFYNVI